MHTCCNCRGAVTCCICEQDEWLRKYYELEEQLDVVSEQLCRLHPIWLEFDSDDSE